MYLPSTSPYLQRSRLRGLGALSPGAQTAEAISIAGASTTVGILVAMGTLGGPIGAAIAGLLAITPLIVNLFSGCGQTCIQATKIANQAAAVLDQNLKAYFSSPTRTASMQAAALNNFDTVWNAVLQGCGQPALQQAGQRCISERQRGGASNWCCAGNPNAVKVADSACGNPPCCTGCDWFILYRDPIANDSAIQPDPVSQAGASLLSSIGVNPSTMVGGVPVSKLLLPAAALLAVWWWNS